MRITKVRCIAHNINHAEDIYMSQHPEQRSEKATTKTKSSNSNSNKSGHGNARESGKKGGSTTHGRN